MKKLRGKAEERVGKMRPKRDTGAEPRNLMKESGRYPESRGAPLEALVLVAGCCFNY